MNPKTQSTNEKLFRVYFKSYESRGVEVWAEDQQQAQEVAIGILKANRRDGRWRPGAYFGDFPEVVKVVELEE